MFYLAVPVTACRTAPELVAATAVPPEPGAPPPTATQRAQQDSSAAEPTPIPPGLSRAKPLPFMETAVLTNWEASVLEILRGDEAWPPIRAVNQFNEPAGDGWEYLLLKLQIKNSYADDKNHRLSLTVTGERGATYYYFDAGVVVPEPQLESFSASGATGAGWLAFRIPYGEQNLLLAIKDDLEFYEPTFYLALAEGAGVATAVFSAITPTSLGTDLSQPAPLGQAATSESWQVTLLDVTRGEPAWQIVYETNQFNDPPPAGMEYLLLKVRLRYIGTNDQGVSVTDSAFTLTNGDGAAYDRPVVVQPEPNLLARLFPGGETEGIIVLMAEAQRKNLALVFTSPVYGAGADTRYFSLGEYGR